MKRIFRFIKALFKYAFTGHFENVGFSEYVDRLSICKECGKYNEKRYMCDICGCYLDKKCKWKTEHCYEGKW